MQSPSVCGRLDVAAARIPKTRENQSEEAAPTAKHSIRLESSEI